MNPRAQSAPAARGVHIPLTQNIYNLRAERSLSTNHIPHRLVLAPIAELPFGKGRRWLNPAAFAVPARFTHGNGPRTLPGVLSPGLVTFDTMHSKRFVFAERFRARFRWEMFNASNTPYFDLPAQDLGAGNFGVITRAGNRRIMQAGLQLYW